jgi:hypothetical protein
LFQEVGANTILDRRPKTHKPSYCATSFGVASNARSAGTHHAEPYWLCEIRLISHGEYTYWKNEGAKHVQNFGRVRIDSARLSGENKAKKTAPTTNW